MCKVFVWLYICFQLVPVPVVPRKYDIELEAMKLYGDGLNSVLARFRRTPEYLEFLKIHLEDLKKERDETAHYLLNIYHKKLMNEIDQMFGVNATRRMWSNPDESIPIERLASEETISLMIHDFVASIGNGIKQVTWKYPYRRADENTTESEEAIWKLDNYHLLHSVLTVEERNNFRDLGFQTAGKLIHALMKSVGPDQSGAQSTRQPWNTMNATTTTTTEHSHMVTRNSSLITIYANAMNTTETKKPLRHGRVRQIML